MIVVIRSSDVVGSVSVGQVSKFVVVKIFSLRWVADVDVVLIKDLRKRILSVLEISVGNQIFLTMFVNLFLSLDCNIPLQALTISTTNSSLESMFDKVLRILLTALILLNSDVLEGKVLSLRRDRLKQIFTFVKFLQNLSEHR